VPKLPDNQGGNVKPRKEYVKFSAGRTADDAFAHRRRRMNTNVQRRDSCVHPMALAGVGCQD
jgi:hypothetical protein